VYLLTDIRDVPTYKSSGYLERGAGTNGCKPYLSDFDIANL
jgi:hypothetical protein